MSVIRFELRLGRPIIFEIYFENYFHDEAEQRSRYIPENFSALPALFTALLISETGHSVTGLGEKRIDDLYTFIDLPIIHVFR